MPLLLAFVRAGECTKIGALSAPIAVFLMWLIKQTWRKSWRKRRKLVEELNWGDRERFARMCC